MQSLTQLLTESKDDKYSSLLSILKDDKLSASVIRRNESYDKNSIKSSRKPKFLINTSTEDEKSCTFYEVENMPENGKPEEGRVVGVYFDRMYYPISDIETVKKLISKVKKINK